MCNLDWQERIENWQRSISGGTDEELFITIKRETSNNGWAAGKARYMIELRDELRRRGLMDSHAARSLSNRVIFFNDET
jgi:hypothetical protein